MNIKEYFSKAFMILPLTFLFTPFFYALLGYHPDIPGFRFLVYFLYAFFVYLGMAVAALLKKYKYLAYPVITATAFLFKDIIALPIAATDKTVAYIIEEGEQLFLKTERTPEEFIYYMFIIFITTAFIGCLGIFYSKYTALDFVNRRNTFLFMNISAISALYYFSCGIMETDSAAAGFYVFCLVSFFASYFLVRNFAMLNRQIEIYRERGTYSASGIHKIYGYYFAMILVLSIAPAIVCLVVMPHIVRFSGTAVNYIIARLILLLDIFSYDGPPPDPDFAGDFIGDAFQPVQNSTDILINYILTAVFFIVITGVIIIFGKYFAALIKSLLTRAKLFDFSKNNIISQEITVKISKDKKHITSYKNYLKKAKKIREPADRYAFAYYNIFWNIIRLEKDLKPSMTPGEVASYIQSSDDIREKYAGLGNLTPPYENVRYGGVKTPGGLQDMISSAERLLREIL
jgi:hypothetical protein